MNESGHELGTSNRSIKYLMNPKKWWQPLLFILIISLAGVGMIAFQTYNDAPPLCDFQNEEGEVVIDQKSIESGQEVFHKYALMEYGSMFGDGAQRGPDFTAEALHEIFLSMNEFYISKFKTEYDRSPSEMEEAILKENVKTELKTNGFNESRDVVTLTAAKIFAFNDLKLFYLDFYLNPKKDRAFPPEGYISDTQEITDLSAFFFWGAWVCVTQRPGSEYSYTHNWPYDPDAGNTPTSPTILWSVIGLLAFVLACGLVLYYIGQYNRLPNSYFKAPKKDFLTIQRVSEFKPTRTQKAAFKFFLVAMILFFLQVTCGFLTLNNFIDFLSFFGIDTSEILPVTISRSWHLMLALFWISACWIASSIFILPILAKKEIKGQIQLVNLLFALIFILVLGSVIGVFLGPHGILGEWWRSLGHQGWEFVEFGKLYQGLLMVIFILWAFIVYRGVKPAFTKGQHWNIPNWIFYSVIGIPLLFISGFVARPETNFVIADFWRWMVIHMWVEAFFEVFITVIVSYLMVLMGLVSRQAAIRVVYFATILFLGTGLLGISHNFYWNAKPVATMALGSVFSTLQFVPLILLTVEAWRFKNMPVIAESNQDANPLKRFGFSEVFLFLVAVNFWNFFGAGVLGIIINLPIMNYFEHGTYLTVNHGHAALMGVYGNISLAAMLFATKLLLKPKRWNPKIIKYSFWSINVGLMLMVILDLFPAGILQFKSIVDNGLWFGRSETFIKGGIFESLTWLRGIGACVFYFGGVIPLTWFVVSRARSMKPSSLVVDHIKDTDEEKE